MILFLFGVIVGLIISEYLPAKTLTKIAKVKNKKATAENFLNTLTEPTKPRKRGILRILRKNKAR